MNIKDLQAYSLNTQLIKIKHNLDVSRMPAVVIQQLRESLSVVLNGKILIENSGVPNEAEFINFLATVKYCQPWFYGNKTNLINSYELWRDEFYKYQRRLENE